MVATAQERRVNRRTHPSPARTAGRGFASSKTSIILLSPDQSAILFALAALRPLAASFIIGNNQVDVTYSERARKFE